MRVGVGLPRRPGQGAVDGRRNGTRPCDLIRQAGEELGIEGLTLQSLRHAWATSARRRWGLSSLVVMAVLRHTPAPNARALSPS